MPHNILITTSNVFLEDTPKTVANLKHIGEKVESAINFKSSSICNLFNEYPVYRIVCEFSVK